MGTTGATFVRFGFGMPFVLILVGILHFYVGYVFPPVRAKFLVWVFVGSLSQIGATFALIYLFSYSNFAVGTAYSRTLPVQAAIFSLLFLGEGIDSPAISAIAISIFGVMPISVARHKFSIAALITSPGQRIAVLGLVSGTGFGFSAVPIALHLWRWRVRISSCKAQLRWRLPSPFKPRRCSSGCVYASPDNLHSSLKRGGLRSSLVSQDHAPLLDGLRP